jgi:hypothetical protein
MKTLLKCFAVITHTLFARLVSSIVVVRLGGTIRRKRIQYGIDSP